MSRLFQDIQYQPSSSNGLSALLDKKRREIREELLHHPDDNRKRFVCETDVRQLWHRTDLKEIFPRWTLDDIARLDRFYLVSFTILVYIGWPIERDAFRSIFLSSDRHVDDELPFKREHLAGLRNEFIELFIDRQYIFRPCTIRRSKYARVDHFDANRPWPFTDEPKKVGCGGYGEVWQAKIAKGCYTNETDEDNLANLNEKVIAYKRFSDGRDYRNEVKSLDYLRESLIKHDHIAVHLAAIVHGKSDFYLFFELTPLGDLELLLNGGTEPNIYETLAPGTIKYDFNQKFPEVRKFNFVEELANIAGALEYLHEILPRTTTLGVHCAHMDLRTKNILVYPRSTGSPNVGKWVLTDFGISSFKHTDPGKPSLDFRTIGDFALETSRTGPHNLQGTHRAPELHQRSDRKKYPGRKCDIWSFGCIANEVLAFLLGGLGEPGVQAAATSLREFRLQKKRTYHDDYWFEHETPSGKISKAIPRRSVVDWLSSVPAKVSHLQPEHANWIRLFVDLLDTTFNITPERRPLASEIGERLRNITQIMKHVSDAKPWGSPILAQSYVSDLFEVVGNSPTSRLVKAKSRQSDQEDRLNIDSTPIGPVMDIDSTTSEASFQPTHDGTKPTNVRASNTTPRPAVSISPPITSRSSQTSDRQNALGISPTSSVPQSPSVPRLRSPTGNGVPESVVDPGSQGSAQSVSGHLPVIETPPPTSSRSQSTTVSAESDDQRLSALDRPFVDWIFALPGKYKVFGIDPTANKAAFVHEDGSQLRISLLDLNQERSSCRILGAMRLSDQIHWNRLAFTSRYMVVSGWTRVPGQGSRQCGHMIDLDQGVEIQKPGGWPVSCQKMTPSSRGAFAWIVSLRVVKIWSPIYDTETGKVMKQDIDHICFNATGTCLFVWTSDGKTHTIATINMLDLAAAPSYTRFDARLVRPASRTAIWAAQSDHACMIHESDHVPRCYIRSDEECLVAPQEIVQESPKTPILESSATALCDNWVALAQVVGSPFNRRIRVTKRYFRTTDGGKWEWASDEILLTEIKRRGITEFQLAAFEERGADKVVLCTLGSSDGHVYRFQSPPNEKLRQRSGSFLM